MNGPQFFEAARHLARRAVHLKRELSDQLDFVASHLLLRPLLEQERGIVRKAYADYLTFYQGHLEQAERMLSVGDSEPDAHLPRAEFAALTMTAHQLLNLDEVLTK